MLGIILPDHVSNDYIRRRSIVADIAQRMLNAMLKYLIKIIDLLFLFLK